MNETRNRIEMANPVPASVLVDEDFVDSDALLSSIMSRENLMTATHRQDRTSPTRARTPWYRTPAFVSVSTAAVVLIFGASALFLGGRFGGSRIAGSQPASTDPTPITVAVSPPITTPEPAGTADTVDPMQLSWLRADAPGVAGPYLYFDGVAAGGPGMIAVGAPEASGAGMIWTSSDGEEWVAADVIRAGNANGYAYDVVAGGPGFVAVGSSVWTSVDGTVWQEVLGDPKVPGDPIRGEARAVTVGGPGLVAVGTIVDGSAIVWTSPDGRSWTRVPHDPTVFGVRDVDMLDVVPGGPGLIAVGRYGGVAAVWTSIDGRDWSRIPHRPEVFGDGTVETEILSVVDAGFGYVAVSSIGDTGLGVWTSPDGLAWSSVALDPTVFDGDEELAVVVSVRDGVISAGFEGDDAAAWFSPDGRTWVRLDGADAFVDEGFQQISDLAIVGEGLVAVGSDFSGDEGSAAVWIAVPDPIEGDE